MLYEINEFGTIYFTSDKNLILGNNDTGLWISILYLEIARGSLEKRNLILKIEEK